MAAHLATNLWVQQVRFFFHYKTAMLTGILYTHLCFPIIGDGVLKTIHSSTDRNMVSNFHGHGACLGLLIHAFVARWSMFPRKCHPGHCWTLVLQYRQCSVELLTKNVFIFWYYMYSLFFHKSQPPYARNTRIPTVQKAVPVPLRPSTADCTVLIRDGWHPYNARIMYGRTRIRVRCSALVK